MIRLRRLQVGTLALGVLLAFVAAAPAEEPARTPAAEDCGCTKSDVSAPPQQPGQPEPRPEASEREARVRYDPPRRGSPRARVAGAVRAARAMPTPVALVPDHVGETVSSQPSLFWHIDAAPARGVQLVFTLIDADAMDPLVEAVLPTPSHSGIQRIRLADYGVRLRAETEYEWSVALVSDPERRADDVVTSGAIRRVEAPDALAARSAGVETYAALGLWYDALESISNELDAAPADASLHAQRDTLLRQAQLYAALD